MEGDRPGPKTNQPIRLDDGRFPSRDDSLMYLPSFFPGLWRFVCASQALGL